ncbi:MAG: hypothetical protein A2V70_15615 [Planctomycetes bacterium RBG_13_63_9]|nr:MAG: hypothetical protein A2V70_15615 [Planctomycetes bacterium RBG_13_63_9]
MGARLLRRREVLAAAVAAGLSRLPGIARAGDDVGNSLLDSVSSGRRFLVRLFDASLDLLPEYAGAGDYWLYHDNYLAAKLLESSDGDLASRIRAAIRRYGVSGSGKIEIVFAEATTPLPFRQPELVTVATTQGKRIRTERLTSRLIEDWKSYTDLLLLAALATADANRAEAERYFELAVKTWDGRGFEDAATRHHALYSTYKLALALLAANRLGVDLPGKKDMLRRLFEQQHRRGGWRTDYDRSGRPCGKANVETTCLVMAALGSEANRSAQAGPT